MNKEEIQNYEKELNHLQIEFYRSLYKQLLEQLQWQPIETAPEIEGEWFLIYGISPFYGTGEVSIGGYCEDKKVFEDITDQNINPTHWMPLPKPPTQPPTN